VLLPPCVAWIVQVPAALNVAVVPLTAQMLAVVEVNETVRPELAVALSVNGVPTVCVPGLAKVMVCAVGVVPVAGVTVTEAVAVVPLYTELLALSGV
jgi:hypothetical protein